ncbi:hypothetical protein D3C78_1892820 [compost metagenome]
MSCATVAGKVLVATEKATVSGNPAGYRFEAGRFRSVEHDDWLLCRHDFVLTAITDDWDFLR